MLVATLAREYRWSEKEILAMPLAKALCYHAAFLEANEIPAGVPNFYERDLLAAMGDQG